MLTREINKTDVCVATFKKARLVIRTTKEALAGLKLITFGSVSIGEADHNY